MVRIFELSEGYSRRHCVFSERFFRKRRCTTSASPHAVRSGANFRKSLLTPCEAVTISESSKILTMRSVRTRAGETDLKIHLERSHSCW